VAFAVGCSGLLLGVNVRCVVVVFSRSQIQWYTLWADSCEKKLMERLPEEFKKVQQMYGVQEGDLPESIVYAAESYMLVARG
jgi:hypothetical protein